MHECRHHVARTLFKNTQRRASSMREKNVDVRRNRREMLPLLHNVQVHCCSVRYLSHVVELTAEMLQKQENRSKAPCQMPSNEAHRTKAGVLRFHRTRL